MSKPASTNVVHPTLKHKVFISFRGEELRGNFISYLINALKEEGIDPYIDNEETMGEDLSVFFKRIKESSIAIAVISSLYSNSRWCLNELAEIKECVAEGTLVVFPVFYKVSVDTVRRQTSTFGENLNQLVGTDDTKGMQWRTALKYVTTKKGVSVHRKRYSLRFILLVVVGKNFRFKIIVVLEFQCKIH
ncbi:hypothetical protein N665_0427s0014 [Sinapis alba]|nr:hypothetical protein N665_0427s0014 [Sinapis alba]